MTRSRNEKCGMSKSIIFREMLERVSKIARAEGASPAA